MFKKDDRVEMHSCFDAEIYGDKTWTCTTDEVTSPSGTNVVFLSGYSGYFPTKFLKKHEHDFSGKEYSKLLGREIEFCPKCSLVKEETNEVDASNGVALVAYKVKLRDDLAAEDENGVGFEYEIRQVPNNEYRLLLCFEDKSGVWRQMRYEKKTVQRFLEKGEWIKA